MINVPSSLNNLKTKIDDLDISKLKTINVDDTHKQNLQKKLMMLRTNCQAFVI